jgi:hypothetical protein
LSLIERTRRRVANGRRAALRSRRTLGRDETSCYFNELIETVNEKKLTAKWRAAEHDCSKRRESSVDLL